MSSHAELAGEGKALKVGVAGIGRWGKKLLSTFAKHTDVVMCVSSGNRENRAWLADNHPNVAWISDFSAMVCDPAVEAVVIASPISAHATQAAEALSQGKHVFVEKPVATDAGMATILAERAAASRLQLFVGHTFLFDEGVQAMLKQTAADEVMDAHFRWQKTGTFGEPMLWTLLPHDVALAIRLFRSTPLAVMVNGRPWDAACDVAEAELCFEGGRRAIISIDRDAGPAVSKTISLTTRYGSALSWRSVPATPSALDNEVIAFRTAVRTGETSLSDGKFGADVARVLDQFAMARVHRP